MPAAPSAVTLPAALLQEVAQTNFGQIYTSPLQSRTIQYVIGLAVSFVGAKIFKATLNTEQVQDWVELVGVLFAAGVVAWSRWRTTHTIMSVKDAVASLIPTFEKAATPQIRAELVQAVKNVNPALGAIVEKEVAAIPYPATP
jgi:hypothetical protein